jgi:hypothetical protein
MPDAVEEVNDLLVALSNTSVRDLASESTAGQTIHRINKLIDLLAVQDSHIRKVTRNGIDAAVSALLLWFAMEQATMAIRDGSTEHLIRGFTALSIEDFSQDYRDSLTPLALLGHSAERLQQNPAELFEQAAPLASPETRRAIMEFFHRPEIERAIETFGYKEGATHNGFTFVPV